MTTSESEEQKPVFDYRALRLLVGLVAFALPFVVMLISSTPLSSISASYHTKARDVFVGLIFVIGALLWAYNGHTLQEKWVSKAGALAAICVAIFPTSCDLCESDTKATIHYGAAVILFSILAYFCLGPFRKKKEAETVKTRRRNMIYLICGLTIVVCMLGAGVTEFAISAATRKALSVTFVAEVVMLFAFGIAWIVAGKVISPLVDERDRLKLF
jgi:hypothetical protein